MKDESWVKTLEEAIQLINKALARLKKVQIQISAELVREEAEK